MIWFSFSIEEFKSAIVKSSNLFIPGLDRISWKHLKVIVKDDKCLKIFINIADICINLGYWPSYFKLLLSIIISKPNKALYDSLKMFQPIVLLNTFWKFIEKVIRERLQFQAISNNFIYSNQLGGLKQQSTTDISIFFNLFDLIRMD